MSAATRHAPLTVLIAPDSFKGSLTSVEVARALADGWARARPDDAIVLSPLADGGEGTLAAVEAAGGWDWRTSTVHDPLGRPVEARWLWREVAGTGMAYIEMAQASGPVAGRARTSATRSAATSIGTGELIAAAAAAGATHITLGIGGSATTDGGRGLIGGLGGHERGRARGRVRRLEPAARTRAARPPSTARRRARRPPRCIELDARNEAWADELERTTGRRVRDIPGAGAAGGVGFALLAIQDRFKSFALRPGIDLVMEATDFDAKLARADLVITGEGRIDAQTAFGKTALGVARRAQAAGVRCIAVGGGVEPEGIEALAAVGATAVPVSDPPLPVEEAMAAGAAPVERCGERLARAWSAAGATA